jgi:hypothetical protein
MTRDRQLKLLAGVGILPCVLAFLALEDQRVKYSIVISACVSFLGFLATKAVIPLIKDRLLRSNLFGKDINKRGTSCMGCSGLLMLECSMTNIRPVGHVALWVL